MNEVKEKHISITISKHGKSKEETEDFFDCLKNTLTIQGNIIDPIDVEWDATK